MTEYVNQALIGDCRDVLRELIEAGVKAQVVVTSPPYFGLRDYGTARWEGGSEECDHYQPGTKTGKATTLRNDGREHIGPYEGERALTVGFPYRDTCGKCGARRIDKQIGLEETIEEYVQNLVEVFRLVWDVLDDSGVAFVNLGDSYSTKPGNGRGGESVEGGKPRREGTDKSRFGLKPKDLCGIPWRVAFALQADGWYLRQDIIISKRNPMPESVTDRCTKSHEYLFLLSKRERYFWDGEAIRDQSVDSEAVFYRKLIKSPHKANMDDHGLKGLHRTKGGIQNMKFNPSGRNKRSVWEITSQAYKGAHFATFPEKLVEPCILAGSRVGDVVLDPFFGSGTTGSVAQRLGRKWIGIDLNPAYLPLQKARTAQCGLGM